MKLLTQTFATASKELRHVLRDRRTVLSTQLYALAGPVLLVATIAAVTGDPDRDPRLGVVGADAAPKLVKSLEASGLEVEPIVEAPLDRRALGERDAVLVIPKDFESLRASRKSAVLRLHLPEDADARRAERRVQNVISRMRSRIVDAELIQRGVSPTIPSPIGLRRVTVGGRGMSERFGTFLLLYIVLAPFLAGVGAATDSATGERERGTLHLMRLQPIDPRAWVLGKMLIVSLFCWAGTLCTTTISVFALERFAPVAAEGLRLTPSAVVTLIVAASPIALIAAAVLFAVALQAKNTMEAQTRLPLAAMLPMGVGFWILMATPDLSAIGYLPVVYEIDGVAGWMAGGAFPATAALINLALCLAVFSAVVLWGARRIVSESYLAGS